MWSDDRNPFIQELVEIELKLTLTVTASYNLCGTIQCVVYILISNSSPTELMPANNNCETVQLEYFGNFGNLGNHSTIHFECSNIEVAWIGVVLFRMGSVLGFSSKWSCSLDRRVICHEPPFFFLYKWELFLKNWIIHRYKWLLKFKSLPLNSPRPQ